MFKKTTGMQAVSTHPRKRINGGQSVMLFCTGAFTKQDHIDVIITYGATQFTKKQQKL